MNNIKSLWQTINSIIPTSTPLFSIIFQGLIASYTETEH